MTEATPAAFYPPALEGCRACARLAEHREAVARRKRRAYADQPYWARPVPGFGDPTAKLLLLGLAPGAHGSNRTGRMFTGDASGDFLFPALHRAGLATRPDSRARGDGQRLLGVWITAALRCAPPDNRPLREEVVACRPWLEHDLARLPQLRAVLALGHIAHDAYLELLKARGRRLVKARYPFAHGARHDPPGSLPMLDVYHVSQQNTATGRLTAAMFDAVLAEAKVAAGL
ncbi:MAG TPA: uracil-DNA glycosylase [Trueperaceae bacterium]|nr:uracil-DNA glycosylase [Trueperaceae bacterium]